MRIISGAVNLDFSALRKTGYYFSIFMVFASLMLVSFRGLNLGIDFSGGLLVSLSVTGEDVDGGKVIQKISNSLNSHGIKNGVVQRGDSDDVVVLRFGGVWDNASIERLKSVVSGGFTNKVNYLSVGYVGPQVGSEQIIDGVLAIVVSLLGMYVYVLCRFNHKFGLFSMVALVHDTILTLGFISLFKIEFNISTIAAILTIIGYSINDSVVIYDRIRWCMHKFRTDIITPRVMNTGINSTLSRTILTSATTMIASVPLIVVCSGEVQDFALVVFWGILVGTYSSIFIAMPPLQSEKELLEEEHNEMII